MSTLEALKLAREYVAEAIAVRKAAFAGHEKAGGVPQMERDLATIDKAIAAGEGKGNE